MTHPNPDGKYRVTVPDSSTGGKFYALRDETHKLIETGWMNEDGQRDPDAKIDGSNPAAMVPVDQPWEMRHP